MSDLVYYVAASLDGYIAGPDGDFSAFPVEGDHMAAIIERFPDAIPTDIASHLGIDQGSGSFSHVVMGWNTYQVGAAVGVASPYRHLGQIVFSRTRSAQGERLRVSSEDPVAVVRELKKKASGDVWLCGGGVLAASLITEIDRLVIKRNPLTFGAGLPLFAATAYAPVRWDLVASTAYQSGVVLEEYVPSS